MLFGKKAVITGASRGIGKAIAELFAENGCELALIATDSSHQLSFVAETCRSKGATVEVFRGSVADDIFLDAACADIVVKFGSVDILINNAGIISRTSFDDTVWTEDWDNVMDVNLRGAARLVSNLLPGMAGREYGRIVNITSQMAYGVHKAANPSYAVSKAGLVAFNRHVADCYAPYGVTSNCIAPGSIDTDLPKSMSACERGFLEALIPTGELGDVADVAQAALFLASDLSRYVTGTTIHVNGGSYLP